MSLYLGTVFRRADGVIVGSIGGASRQALAVPAEFGIVDGEHAAADSYVLDGEVVARATMAPTISAADITADGADECGISGLPDPCTVALHGAVTQAPTVVIGGNVTITSTVPGTITVQITADPVYQAWEATIHAV